MPPFAPINGTAASAAPCFRSYELHRVLDGHELLDFFLQHLAAVEFQRELAFQSDSEFEYIKLVGAEIPNQPGSPV